MANGKEFTGPDANGVRFDFKGISLNYPIDAMPPGKYPFAENVRANARGVIYGRPAQGAALYTLPAPLHTLRRLNDTSPLGPAAGYARIAGAADKLYVDQKQAVAGLSGNPVSLVPFRPNTSVQPWMYAADANGMYKLRSDGLAYKMGVAEPQFAPVVGTEASSVSGTFTVPGNARPWSNVSGQNPQYNYGDTGAGAGPAVLNTPAANASVTLTATGSVTTVNGTHAAGDAGGTGSAYPGKYLTGGGPAPVLIGAFTDGQGNVIATVAASDMDIVAIGGQATLLVPTNAQQLQVGVNAPGGSYGANTGAFAVSYTVTTSAVATKVSLGGPVTAYYWGDSPHSGPVGLYIWQSESDGHGAGPARGIANAVGSTTGSSLLFDQNPTGDPTLPVEWTVFDSSGNSSGTTSVFQPAIESAGYSDFNLCIVANIFIPAAGTYTFEAVYKDNILWGIGNNASWQGSGTLSGNLGQSKTVVNGLPLLPAPVNPAGGTTPGTVSVAVTFPSAGLYPLEVDWDYWYHSGRTLQITVNGANLAPLPAGIKTNVQYRYVGRSSATGAVSNPSPESLVQSLPVLANTIACPFLVDPQVDKLDVYRMDQSLDNFTYVLTTENTDPPTAITDTLLDIDVSSNPILQFDNFEPFPSLDLPRRGIVNVIGGTVYWVSGDKFNLRWLPGSLINIGGVAYSLDRRPTSITELTAGDVESGNDLVYELDAATLAGQPLKSMWGPTNEGNFMFGCGDPLRPGTIYWTKGNNPDAAPDTNQDELTSPAEPLINGCIANGVCVIFSADRSWITEAVFTEALAQVTGNAGTDFTFRVSDMTRGLYIRSCLTVSGGGTIFFRTKDGIAASSGGGRERSITDDDIYQLFTHESVPAMPITLAGRTIYPPDDIRPEAQRLAWSAGYVYYDYLDAGGTPRTLVFDEQAGGWVVDTYLDTVTVHANEEGPLANAVVLGTTAGTVRQLSAQGAAETATVLTAALNAGEDRAAKQVGDLYLRASVAQGDVLEVAAWADGYSTQLPALLPSLLNGDAGTDTWVLDVENGAQELRDIGLALSWSAGYGTALELWRPSWIPLPETTQGRVTDWTDGGYAGAKFVQGLRVEANTFGLPKRFAIQASDDGSLHMPNEMPAVYANQTTRAFSFAPFIAHDLRLVPQDSVPWRTWGIQYVFEPYPELVEQFQTELASYGPGWQSVREINLAYIAPAPLALVLTFDQWPAIAIPSALLPASPSQLYPIKTKITVPVNKSKLVAFGITSAQPFRLFKPWAEIKVGVWGRSDSFQSVRPFGGDAADGAEV